MKSLRELLGEIGRPHTRRKTLDLERLENRLLLDFTIPPAFDGDIDLNTGTDTGPDGVIRIFGDDADDESGYSVSPAGDVNGDGYEDLLIGAPYADPAGGVEAGETYLVFGRGVSGPYVTTPTDLGSYVGPVSSVEVTFNEAIDESTFTLVDTAIQLSGGGSSQATSIDSLGGNSYRLNFAPRSAAGDYYVVVGPNVEDLAGNEMNQNGNGINGESDDEYWGQFTIGYVDTIHGPNGQQVMIFDLVGPVDINAEDVVVKFGDGNTVKSIKLTGYDSMEGLGVVVSGATYVGGVFDARTGTPRPLAFIACDSPIGTVNLRGGIAGYDLNGLTLAGLALPDDIDGDGETDDPTGIYSGGYLRSVLARGDVAGDVVVGGDLNFLQVIGGDLTGDVVLTGSKIGKVIVKNGDITGDIEADGDIGTVMAIGGDIMGSIVSDSGRISRVLAKGVRTGWSWRGGSIGDGSPDGIISAADYVGSVQALKGDGISTSISAGTWIGLVKSLGGDIDLTEGRSIEAGGTIKNILAIDGDIVGDGGDVHIANGNLGRLRAIRGAIDSVYADVDGSPSARTGRIGSVKATGAGGIANSIIEAEGRFGSLWSAGSITGEFTAHDGLGSVYAKGDLSALVDVTGNLGKVNVRGDVLSSSIDVTAGNFGALWAGGDIQSTEVLVPGGRFSSLYAKGNLHNSTIDAHELRKVNVRGQISEDDADGDTDEIHAETGRFLAGDTTWRGWIPPDHWFDNVRAWVGPRV